MLDDIYALGVVLLELGLSKSLANWVPYSSEPLLPGASPKGFYYLSKEAFDPEHAIDGGPRGGIIFDNLKKLASVDLKNAMGSEYASAVLQCLQCREQWRSGFNFAADDEDWHKTPAVQVNFIERVLSVLDGLQA